jgi:hypothetical protein
LFGKNCLRNKVTSKINIRYNFEWRVKQIQYIFVVIFFLTFVHKTIVKFSLTSYIDNTFCNAKKIWAY